MLLVAAPPSALEWIMKLSLCFDGSLQREVYELGLAVFHWQVGVEPDSE